MVYLLGKSSSLYDELCHRALSFAVACNISKFTLAWPETLQITMYISDA